VTRCRLQHVVRRQHPRLASESVVAHVLLYSRVRCGLCDEAREVILSLMDRHRFTFEEVSIDGNEGLERAHGLRIPVVLVDGREAFETFVDPDSLARLL
jgi:Glutaredoxin-like domain (DUF836)